MTASNPATIIRQRNAALAAHLLALAESNAIRWDVLPPDQVNDIRRVLGEAQTARAHRGARGHRDRLAKIGA